MVAEDVELVVDVPRSGLVLRTDPALVERVVVNLLSNAVKFTPHGHVRCTAAPVDAGDVIEIAVSDTGIGIPPEHQERVFEEFYQVPGPLQRARAGTGLGLSYARRVATVLGGSLTLDSEPGRGTTLVLRLPVALGADGPGRYDDVLVVEDDPAFREIAHSALQPFTERITDAGSGVEALHILAERRPDLVMLDLNIPAPDGKDVLDRMRSDPGLARRARSWSSRRRTSPPPTTPCCRPRRWCWTSPVSPPYSSRTSSPTPPGSSGGSREHRRRRGGARRGARGRRQRGQPLRREQLAAAPRLPGRRGGDRDRGARGAGRRAGGHRRPRRRAARHERLRRVRADQGRPGDGRNR